MQRAFPFYFLGVHQMDISKFAAQDSSDLQLRTADDQPLIGDDGVQVSITCYGPGSKAYQRAQSTSQNKLIDRMKRKGNVDQTPEEKAAQRADFLAACTVSFNGFDYKGKADQAAFKAAYADSEIGFVTDQVEKFISDWANFTTASTTA